MQVSVKTLLLKVVDHVVDEDTDDDVASSGEDDDGDDDDDFFAPKARIIILDMKDDSKTKIKEKLRIMKMTLK